eukprot:295886_1
MNRFVLAEEKHDTDNDIDDGYKNVTKHALLASSEKRGQQNGTNYEVKLKTVKTDNIDFIQKCIGQIMISYDGSDNYFYGTGTMYKQFNSKYCLILTCAHNLVEYNDIKKSKQKATKIFYLPKGINHNKIRLECIDWVAHEKYDPNIKHCPYDIGVILCCDGFKYYN